MYYRLKFLHINIKNIVSAQEKQVAIARTLSVILKLCRGKKDTEKSRSRKKKRVFLWTTAHNKALPRPITVITAAVQAEFLLCIHTDLKRLCFSG